MDLELAGKAVLITGGTDGLGLALATQLAAEGAAVGVCGRDEERLRAAEETLRAAGGDVLAQRADVSRPEDLEAFVDAAVARWGRIDGVVHNAGRASARRHRVDRRRHLGGRLPAQADGRGAAHPAGAARSCGPAGAPSCSRWPWRPRRPVRPASRARSPGRPAWRS